MVTPEISESAVPRRVLISSEVRGDTRRYRALHPIEQLRLLGVQMQFVHLTDRSFESYARQPWDLVIFHRVAYRDFLEPILRRFKEAGTILLSDFDDLIYDPGVFEFINSPDFSDPVRARIYKGNMLNIQKMLELSEGVTASTNYLADQIRRVGKPVWVHRNAFSFKMLASSEQARQMPRDHAADRVVIGYASGTPTHNHDFEMIRPALQRIMAQYPQVELRLIGPLDPGDQWGRVGERIRRLPLVPWRALPGVLAQFDINLAPLVTDNPFAQSKSEIKYMEAAMVGVPTVASPTDAFCYAIRPGQNGFLANNEIEWEGAIVRLVEDAQLRSEVGEAARNAVVSEYHPAVRAMQFAGQLEQIAQSLRGASFWDGAYPQQSAVDRSTQQAQLDGGWVPPQYEKNPSYFQLGRFYLRTTGVKATAQRVWIYFRRMVSPIFPFKH